MADRIGTLVANTVFAEALTASAKIQASILYEAA